MILVVCLDDGNGMGFNRRRQSQDRLLRADLLREAAGRAVWMSPYTRAQFPDPPETLCTAEDPLDRAGPGELCFAETADPAPWAARVEEIVLYRWNRRYPADLYCTLPLEDFVLEERREFAGSSHECITREVYRR